MSIIISKKGSKAKKVDKSSFDKEDYLQNYIYENPESIPLYEIKEDVRLLILAREFSVGSGSIDALAIDREGEIYLIETKLYKNPDKRLVVAQVLDYGASMWRAQVNFDDFLDTLATHVRNKFEIGLSDKVKEFFTFEDLEYEGLIDNFKQNLNNGNYKFIVLMDRLHSQLKDLILYINENSKFDVYAVELEYYKHEDMEIMIPKIFGAEVKKTVTGSSRGQYKWNEESLLKDAEQKFSPLEFEQFKAIYDYSKKNADRINYGAGTDASFSPIFECVCSKSLFTLTTDKRLSFNFDFIKHDNEAVVDVYKDKLVKAGFRMPDNYRNLRPSSTIDEWGSKKDDFIAAIKGLVEAYS